jgi:AcrR family transcriptional regulator
MANEVKRPYRSTRRDEQATETRQRIIDAARELFITEGYGRTTIAQVADAAGVAVETVYKTYRNKPTLLRQVWYATFRGDEQDIRLLHRPEIQAVLAEPDLATRLRAHAVVYTPVFRRMTPLLRALQGAATSLDAAAHYAHAAAETGQLAISEHECCDLLAATLDGALWHRLVGQQGWSDDRYAQLLGTLWVAALVRSQPAGA